MADRLAPRGTPAQTRLAHEFGLHEYIWPRICGHERWKWERAVAVIDKAAQNRHRRECSGPMADGRTPMRATPYVGDHAERHRSAIRMALVDLVDAGIPTWLTERDPGPGQPSSQAGDVEHAGGRQEAEDGR